MVAVDVVVKKASISRPEKAKYGDLGTPEMKARHHVDIEVRERTSTGHPTTHGGRVKDQTPMDRYFQRRLLDKDGDKNYILFHAGERLMADFYYSGLVCKTTASYEPRIKGVYNFMEHREDKIRHYKSAMKDVPETLRHILVHVCCLQGAANEWATTQGHNPESGIVVLRLALTELALHYGTLKKVVDKYSENKVAIKIV